MSDIKLSIEQLIQDTAQQVLEIEAQAIRQGQRALNSDFSNAVQLIVQNKGKLVFSGIGKSGLIARKLASTFSSTGSSSVYLHPAEAAHGDLGILTEQDILVAISQSGRSQELALVFNHAARISIPILFFTGNPQSELARLATLLIDTQVEKEACPLGLAPTASSTLALALGDALAMSVLKVKGFTAEDFRHLHPAGGLGQRLLRVQDLMHKGEHLPLIEQNADFSQVLVLMSRGDVRGACGVLNSAGELIGIITDGDIRRRLQQGDNPMSLKAAQIMSHNPRTIAANELATRALFVMQEFRIGVLFVVDSDDSVAGVTPQKSPVGLLHIQDLLKARVT